MKAADLLIEMLANENAQLVDLIADLAWENYCLRLIADRAFRHPYQRRQVQDATHMANERAA